MTTMAAIFPSDNLLDGAGFTEGSELGCEVGWNVG